MRAAAPRARRLLRVAVAALGVAAAGCGAAAPLGEASEGLVLARQAGTTTDLWRVRLSDGAERDLVTTPYKDELWPYWSPAAGRLVYQVQQLGSEKGDQLRLLDPASGRDAPLVAEAALRQHWPVWSPDGAHVAYAFSDRRDGAPVAGLALAATERAERTVLAWTGRGDAFFRPEFSPDASRLIAQRHAPGAAGSQLWLLEPGAAPRRLTASADDFEQKGRFTRDGAWIVYTRRTAHHRPADLVLLRPDGSDAHSIASLPDSDDHTARPSPTRDEIAFISDRDGGRDLFLADLDGGRVRNLTRTPDRRESAPRWSPDGERIAVTALPASAREEARWSRLEHHRVVVVDRAGRELLDTPGAMPDWMPPW